MENRVKSTVTLNQLLEKGYATVCITLDPREAPSSFLRKILSISADKIGSLISV